MPRQPNYITAPAVITKAQIAELAALHGQRNAAAVVFDGQSFQPGALVYVTFAGARRDDGLYHGVQQFRLATAADEGATALDFALLLQTEAN